VEPGASFIRVTRVGELGTKLAVTTNLTKIQLFLCSARRLLVTASVVPSSPILLIVMKEALSFSEMPVLIRATRRNIPEGTVLDIGGYFKAGLFLKEFLRYLTEDKEEMNFSLCNEKGFSDSGGNCCTFI
jgi:hypothetical protein